MSPRKNLGRSRYQPSSANGMQGLRPISPPPLRARFGSTGCDAERLRPKDPRSRSQRGAVAAGRHQPCVISLDPAGGLGRLPGRRRKRGGLDGAPYSLASPPETARQSGRGGVCPCTGTRSFQARHGLQRSTRHGGICRHCHNEAAWRQFDSSVPILPSILPASPTCARRGPNRAARYNHQRLSKVGG